ncbi:MAG: hypothetical protein QOD80_2160 [Verrucomicrobiota bacterium]
MVKAAEASGPVRRNKKGTFLLLCARLAFGKILNA